jgi:hypothetical protein
MSNKYLLYKCQRQIIFAIHLRQEYIEDTTEVNQRRHSMQFSKEKGQK